MKRRTRPRSPRDPNEIQRMFEDMGLGTEEARARFRGLCPDQEANERPKEQVFIRIENETPCPQGDDNAELA